MKKKLLLISTLFIAIVGTINAQTILYSEDFEGTTGTAIPSTWTQSTLATDGGWKSGTALSSTSFTIPAHTRYLATNDDACNCDKSNDFLKTVPFSCVGASHPVASFDILYFDGTYQGTREIGTIEVSTNGGTTWTVLDSLGAINSWTNYKTDLSAYAGMANVMLGFRYNDASGWMYGMAIDNFSVFQPAPNDIALQSIAPTGMDCWGSIGSTKTITGTIVNNGSNPITAFTASFTDGTANGSSNFTGLNVNYNQTYNFTIATPFSITAATQANLKVYVNLTSDSNQANDTLNTQVSGYSFVPNHKVVYEEATGTWCGYCVRGLVYMDSLQNSPATANTTVRIAVHNNDPMVSTAYDAGVGALIAGYPTILVDRAFSGDPSLAFTAYTAYINDFGLGDLTLTQSYDISTRLITATVNANMASSFTNNTASNDYRLAVVITEDQVHGTTSAYNQHNYYTGNTLGAMSGAGHDFAAEPDPVPAANMYYNFVARAILGGFKGQANSLPSGIVAGNTYSKAFTYTVPSGYDVTKMKINGLLIDAKNNIIYNGNTAALVTGISSIDATKQSFSLYPNPVTNTAMVDFNLADANNVSISLINALGQIVLNKDLGIMNVGAQNYSFDAAPLHNGLYFLNIKIGNNTITKKVAINK